MSLKRIELKGIIEEDFIQYKKPCMVLLFPKCTFKCEKECGQKVCQNSALALSEGMLIDVDTIIGRYTDNDITQAICMGGLEPFDSFEDMLTFIKTFRFFSDDDIVIYTGYRKDELTTQLNELKKFKNIIIKFGRFIPNSEPIFDEILGVELASSNQKAERLIMDDTPTLKIRKRIINSEEDQEIVDAINEGLAENKAKFGKPYCPCRLEHIPENVCPCKEFRDQTEPGLCHCGKFEKYFENTP